MRWLRIPLLVLCLIAAAGPAGAGKAGDAPPRQFGPYFSGQLLVARPTMGDPRFAETVIYLADHSSDGAFGLVINRVMGRGPLKDFLVALKQQPADDITGDVDLMYGGPLERGAGFVLHTDDYLTADTRLHRGNVAVTTSPTIMHDIAIDHGPRRRLIIFGYAGWGPGQLEGELQRGDWDIAPFDENLVFGPDPQTKWARARKTVGIPM